jgi:hypothetical protein
MPRIDDFQKARELAKVELAGKDPKEISIAVGAEWNTDPQGNMQLIFNFLNTPVKITWPDLVFSRPAQKDEISIQQQILLLHYLNGAPGIKVQGEWISYHDVPDGKFYMDAFLRRAKNPMVQVFGSRPELLVKLAATMYDAKLSDQGDLSVILQALPLVSVVLILWKGDEEFPPEGNIIFDRSIIDILSAEDIAWLSGMIIYPLIGMATKQ